MILIEPNREMQTIITQEGILLVLRLPVVKKEKYALKKVFALPHHISDDKFVIPRINVSSLAYNIQSRIYFSIKDPSDCSETKYSSNEFICSGIDEKKYNSDDCAIRDFIDHSQNHTFCSVNKFIIEGDYFKEIHPNVWFFFFKEGQKMVSVVCENRKNNIMLNMTGIIHLSTKCVIQIGTRTLGGKMIGRKSIIKTHVKIISPNHTRVQTSSNESSLTLKEGIHFIDSLDDSLIFPLENVTFSPIERRWIQYEHHWLGYLVIALLSGIVLCVIFVVIYKFCIKSRSALKNLTSNLPIPINI